MKIWIWRMHSETSSGVLGVMVYNGIISLLWWATSAFNSLNISWWTGNGVASVKWYYRIVECNILHVRLMQRIETHGKKLKIVTALKYKKLRYSSIYRCNIWYITFDMFLSYKKKLQYNQRCHARTEFGIEFILCAFCERVVEEPIVYRTGFFRDDFFGFFGFLLHSLTQKLYQKRSSSSKTVMQLAPSRSPISPPTSPEKWNKNVSMIKSRHESLMFTCCYSNQIVDLICQWYSCSITHVKFCARFVLALASLWL